MKSKIDYSIYLVTDRELMSTATIEQSVEQAIQGGCTLVQLREKDLSTRAFHKIAKNTKTITDQYKIPLIINDRIDIALAVDAAGVHIGQSDMPAKIARSIIGYSKILGVSVSNTREAKQAEEDGADYIGVGAMFSTETKSDATLVSMKELKQIREATTLPIVVIGGINRNTIPLFAGTQIDGIAVVSAIISEKNITLAAEALKELFVEAAGKIHE